MNSDETVTYIAKRIRELSDVREISTHELAIRTGLFPSTLSAILKGENRNPGIITLDKISRALSISSRDFWTD